MNLVPPAIDISISHESLQHALSLASARTSFELDNLRLQAQSVRDDLADDVVEAGGDGVDALKVHEWFSALSDEKVVAIVERMGELALVDDLPGVEDFVHELLSAAV